MGILRRGSSVMVPQHGTARQRRTGQGGRRGVRSRISPCSETFYPRADQGVTLDKWQRLLLGGGVC